MELSVEDLRSLIELERKMDRGEVPYIYVEGCGSRAAMDPAAMTALGLETGQVVPLAIWVQILELKIRDCEAALAHQRLAEIEAEEVL